MSSIFELHRKGREEVGLPGPLATDHPVKAPGEMVRLDGIATVPARLNESARIAYHTDPHGCAADRFRFLRMQLRQQWNAGKWKSLLITSPLPAEGKSTTALNLATALAEKGERSVLLLEADLYRAGLAESLGIAASSGLAGCLEQGLDPQKAIRRVSPLGFYLLPGGIPEGHPTELLQTAIFASLMQLLLRCFDYVLVDSPPVIPLVDALLLKQYCDATLLVARAGRTPRELLEKTVSLIGRKHIFGVVFNGAEHLQKQYSKYSQYYKRS